jgi:cysteine-S-conjugate beta-lyase
MTEIEGKSGHFASPDTLLTHGGRHPEGQLGFVNTPVFRGSTVLFSTLDALEDQSVPHRYGRNDNPTVLALCELVSELEGAAGTIVGPSGVAAVTTALMAVLKAGDEVLVTDSAYEPTRNFAKETLAQFGVSVRYYDPRIGAGIAGLFSDTTRAVMVESPGSLTFEMQDLPAIAAAARARGISVIVDNSWGTPLFHQPLKLGADIVVHAGTKMFVGHSDVMIGTASANASHIDRLKRTRYLLGLTASPDDAYLTLRGLRTLSLRMAEHSRRSQALASWLEQQDEVLEVYHPALPSHPDHALWARDFAGAGSLFAFRLKPRSRAALAAMVDGFQLFGMGYSWGGFESLCLPINPSRARTAVPWTAPGQMFRIHVGLEGFEDLKADLAAGLARYAASPG